MLNFKKNSPQGNTVRNQIRKLVLIESVTLIFITAAIIIITVSINLQYDRALLCANTAADFNKEFKSSLDLEMYNHVIKSRTPDSVNDLPLSELDDAETVLQRLNESTSLPDNRWRVQSMLDMCANLRSYMIEIANTESYDERMALLERNIRGETGLTVLIEQYMHDYIDDEVRELARLSVTIRNTIYIIIFAVILIIAIFAVIIIVNSVRITRRIVDPISQLSSKARNFGDGDFSVAPIATDLVELQTLDQNFDKMADHIDSLMEKQMEDQKILHQTELELLQAQINPHFLYNTLDSIVILAESDRGEDVINMVTSLSTFFRNSLNSGQDIITLKAEAAQAASYLEIQQIRYSDIMTYSMDIPDELLDCMVPKLILQPLIENALYHGIKNRRGRGCITISGRSENGCLYLEVSDNGAGMAADQLWELRSGEYQEHHRGLGLKNVDQRIRLYCGNEYGLSFASTLGEGTTVTVKLPENGISKEAM